jgi:hypothetical protein
MKIHAVDRLQVAESVPDVKKNIKGDIRFQVQ